MCTEAGLPLKIMANFLQVHLHVYIHGGVQGHPAPSLFHLSKRTFLYSFHQPPLGDNFFVC